MLNRLYAEEYLSTDSEGATWNKAQDIEIDTTGNFRLASYKLEDMNVRFYDGVGVVTGRSTLEGTFLGSSARAGIASLTSSSDVMDDGSAWRPRQPRSRRNDGRLNAREAGRGRCGAAAGSRGAFIGIVGLCDLRMLGLVKGLPFKPLNRLLPWGIAGFVINLITGFLFFAGAPFQYIHNQAFGWKMAFVLLAGVNVCVFYFTGISRRVGGVQSNEEAPMSAKIVAATSLFLWIGVMYWGRMLPFLGGAF